MCASVFINTIILLNKAFLVIAWRWIHIDFCRYADGVQSAQEKRFPYHTNIWKREPIFYSNKVVTLRLCQLRYRPFVCLYWKFNWLFSKGPSPFSWPYVYSLLYQCPDLKSALHCSSLQRRHGINIGWQRWEHLGRGWRISPDAAIVFTACYSEIQHKKVWLMTDDL